MKITMLITASVLLGFFILYRESSETSNEEQTLQTDFCKSLEQKEVTMSEKILKTDKQWRDLLTDDEYRITRKKGTEPPFSGKYNNFKKEGIFLCVCCGNELFSSEAKSDSGTGWPSFRRPISEKNIREVTDRSHFMLRTEVLCNRCEAHLGHVFEDGPKPAGLRYCINSAGLKFSPQNSE